MAHIRKPQVNITQDFELGEIRESTFLPTILLGSRYSVLTYPEDKSLISLGQYLGSNPSVKEFAYPNRDALSKIDLNYVKLFMEQVDLRYYDSDTEGSTWRKIGKSPNKLRTILSSGLIFKTDPQELFSHSAIFKDRGVKIGDYAIINTGSQEIKTKIIGFEADKSVSSIDPVDPSGNNQTSQANSIGSANAGSNSGTTLASSNTGGTYSGSLVDNVLEDTYTVRVIESGTEPATSVVQPGGATITAAVNKVYDFSASETYTVEIITGGAPGTATYRVISSSGTDNEAEQATPTLGTPTSLGTRGLEVTFSGSGSFNAGDKYVVSVDPSNARLQITTASDTDEVLNRVFPGFGFATNIGTRGVELTFSVGTSNNLTKGDLWTVAVTKQLDQVVSNESGSFSGSIDINYVVEVIQGGGPNVAALRVISTFTDGNTLITFPGFGSSNEIDIGAFGVKLFFDANVQNGLIKGDKYSITAKAAKDTAFKTIVVQNTIPEEADQSTVGAAAYSGSNISPNTGTSGGSYNPNNSALDLNASEIYSVIVTTSGAYGVAEIEWTSSSGLDDSIAPVVIPVTPGEEINIGTKGVTIAFTGTETFELTDRWDITVTKTDLDIKLVIRKDSVEVPRKRQDAPTVTAWDPVDQKVTINPNLCLQEISWDPIECLPINESIMYLHYRALHTIGSESVIQVSNISDIEANLGKDHIDNPIARGARFALLNSLEEPIHAAYVKSDDLSGWSSLVEKLEVRNKGEVYRMGVLDSRPEIIDVVINHADKMSTPTKNKWRTAYISKKLPKVFDVIGTAESSDFTATVVEDPANPGVFSIMKSSNTNFDLAAIGDTVVYLGNEHLVKSVRTSSEIEIDPPLGAPQNVASTIYIFHVPTVQELAELYSFFGQQIKNRRIVHIVPDEFIGLGEKHPSIYMTAIIAGLKAGKQPHQGLTNSTLTGVDRVNKTLFLFNEDQLDAIAHGGNFIIAQDSLTDVPYVRHQLTTNADNLKFRELSITENLDDLSYGVLDIVKPFIGRFNLHTGALDQIRANIEGFLFTKTEPTDDFAGPQILDSEITRLEQAENAEDTLIIELRLFLPAPINYIDVTITV